MLIGVIVYRRVRSRFTKDGMMLIRDLEIEVQEDHDELLISGSKFSIAEIGEEDEDDWWKSK